MIDITTVNTNQLSEFCAIMIPCIWSKQFKRTSILNPKRHQAFKLFVQKVLKATQISCTCIILALHYIQKLRSAYPSIRASIGSEVRLFTTALVLANKYLDDNTFTNKTWSQVSNIPVKELNIMEIEFLSALNYTIHLPCSQYFLWKSECQQYYQTLVVNNEAPITTKRTFDSLQETQQQPPRKKYFSMDPFYYPQNNNIICKPILSWSSSVSALSSSKYNNNASTTSLDPLLYY